MKKVKRLNKLDKLKAENKRLREQVRELKHKVEDLYSKIHRDMFG